MFQALEWWIAARYTRVQGGGRGNGFVSFISAVSMLGIALGVATLIIVLSVMNGFQKEVRDRMLSVVSHIEIYGADTQAAPAGQDGVLQKTLRRNLAVQASAPFVMSQVLLARGDALKGMILRGIDPAQEGRVSPVFQSQESLTKSIAQLRPGEFQLVLGFELAQQLGVGVGDTVTVVLPSGQLSVVGMVPRFKQFQIVGLLRSGHFEYDSTLALTHVRDAAALVRDSAASGLRVRLNDLHEAPRVAAELIRELGPNYWVRDWTQQNRNWFAAVQLEKRMMFIILILIVAVAAFNLVSTLIMSVTDKAQDIAILRTLGASPGSIMRIFLLQGSMVGVLGTLLGLCGGLLIAYNIGTIVPWLERMARTSFLPQDVYLINQLPSDPQMADILPVVLVSLALSFVMTLYPSWRASRVHPAVVLR